jgi:methylmalonyl-CoA/ethylmalonyl-CoA epimerase
MRFDHIGILADDLQSGRAVLNQCFDIHHWTEEVQDDVNGVFIQFCRDSSEICYEVVAPLNDQSPVIEALTARRNILNHVAYLVCDLQAEAIRLRRAGTYAAGPPKPAIAYGGRRIQFFVTPLRFILELIEAPDHNHKLYAG